MADRRTPHVHGLTLTYAGRTETVAEISIVSLSLRGTPSKGDKEGLDPPSSSLRSGPPGVRSRRTNVHRNPLCPYLPTRLYIRYVCVVTHGYLPLGTGDRILLDDSIFPGTGPSTLTKSDTLEPIEWSGRLRSQRARHFTALPLMTGQTGVLR